MSTYHRETASRLTSDDLDFVADALLAMCAADASAPAYTEAAFRYKLRRARAREPIAARILGLMTPDPLTRSEVEALLASARLTPHQYECVSLRLDGFTFAEIGGFGGTSKQNSRAGFVAALGKLRRAWRRYPYAGLAEVYRAETRRSAEALGSRPLGISRGSGEKMPRR